MEGGGYKFAGYASVFDGVDSYGDTILKGAFEETLKTHGMPKMFYNHDWSGLPLGKYLSASEDSKGLYVEGELTQNMSLSEDVRAAMAHKTIDGLSIGGFLKKGDYEETEKGRRITKWSKLMEISPVVFPADSNARIDTVKGIDFSEMIDEIKTIRDFETFLRDASGFSKGATLALVARAKSVFSQWDAGENNEKANALLLSERVNSLASRLNIK